MPTETPLPTVTPVRRFPDLATGTPLERLIYEVKQWMQTHDATLVGGARAHDALTPTAELQTNVTDAATVAGKPALGVAATYATEFQENFDAVPASWLVTAGAANQTTAGTGQTGGKALRQTGAVTQVFPFKLPYDPSKLHRLRARAKNVTGAGTFSFGVQALNAAGAVLGTYAAAANGAAPGTSYVDYTGWVRGVGTPGAMPASDPKAPSALPAGTVALRPYYSLNGGAPSGVMDLDYVSYERQDEDATARVVQSLLPTEPTNPDWDARYTTGARTVANAIDTDSVQVDVVLTARVESIDDPTIFLDLRTGRAPTDLVFSHPAFALYFDGTAVFAGEVSADTFTATMAEFASGVRVGVGDPTTGRVLVYNAGAGDDVLTLSSRSIGGVPAVSANLDAGVYPLHVSASAVRFNADPVSDTDTDVTVKGDLTVTGTITGALTGTASSASGGSGAFSGTFSGSASGSFSGSVSASSFSYTGGATSITGSRTTDVASILDQIINVLAAHGLASNGTSA